MNRIGWLCYLFFVSISLLASRVVSLDEKAPDVAKSAIISSDNTLTSDSIQFDSQKTEDLSVVTRTRPEPANLRARKIPFPIAPAERRKNFLVLDNSTLTPTVSFAPTLPRPTNTLAPTPPPVPTGRPSRVPTARPTSPIVFTGTGSVKYLQISSVWKVQLTFQTAYNSYNLPAITTNTLLRNTFQNFLDVPTLSLQFVKQEYVDVSTLSWTLNLYYNIYAPLNGILAKYYDTPIEFYKVLKANFSTYAPSYKDCCLSTEVSTYYLAAGANYNLSIARTFIFQSVYFDTISGFYADPTSPPTRSPTSKPTVQSPPTQFPTTSAPTVVPPAAKPDNTMYIIYGVVGGAVFIFAVSFLYYLYATKRFCFNMLDKDDDEDDEEEESEEDSVVSADATFVKAEMHGEGKEDVQYAVDLNADGTKAHPHHHHQRPRRRTASDVPGVTAAPVDEWTAAMNNVGSWLGVPPSDKPVLNIVDLNSAWDNWMGVPTQSPDVHRRRSNTPPPVNGRRNSNTPPNQGEWQLDNISSWVNFGVPTPMDSPEQSRRPRRRPSPDGSRRGPPNGQPGRGPPNGQSGRGPPNGHPGRGGPPNGQSGRGPPNRQSPGRGPPNGPQGRSPQNGQQGRGPPNRSPSQRGSNGQSMRAPMDQSGRMSPRQSGRGQPPGRGPNGSPIRTSGKGPTAVQAVPANDWTQVGTWLSVPAFETKV